MRPNRKLSEPGPEVTFDKDGVRHTLRQIGWVAHTTGEFYALNDPVPVDGLAPLYFTAHSEVVPSEETPDVG